MAQTRTVDEWLRSRSSNKYGTEHIRNDSILTHVGQSKKNTNTDTRIENSHDEDRGIIITRFFIILVDLIERDRDKYFCISSDINCCLLILFNHLYVYCVCVFRLLKETTLVEMIIITLLYISRLWFLNLLKKRHFKSK